MRVVFMRCLFSTDCRSKKRKRKVMYVSYVYAAYMVIISDSNFNVRRFEQSRLLIMRAGYYFLKVAEGLRSSVW